MDTETPRPFRIELPEELLDDLRRRLGQTRWPDLSDSDEDWSDGVPLAYLRDLCSYWQHEFDWRAVEAGLNELPHFRVALGDADLHYIHVAGNGPSPLPLVLTHGWPSSFFEFSRLIPLLADPGAHGGDPDDAFDVVVPAYPGFPFSTAPPAPGLIGRVPDLWRALMCDVLGYPRFGAFGGDIGAVVTAGLAHAHPEVLIGIHVLAVFADLDSDDPDVSPAERAFLRERTKWAIEEGGYRHQQETRPATLAYGLADSPAGLAAWIVEKQRAWSDRRGAAAPRFNDDELLVTPTLYWAANSIGPSFRPYREAGDILTPRGWGKLAVPAAVSLFPADVPLPPRELAERHYDVRRWTEMPRGGHFAALEEPELLAAELRAGFRDLRD